MFLGEQYSDICEFKAANTGIWFTVDIHPEHCPV